MTPNSYSYLGFIDLDDGALEVGKSYTDSTAGVTITTVATSTTGATVQVTLATPTCVHMNPTVTISPSSQWGNPGQALSYSVNVTNNDSSVCTSSTFGVTPTLPSGFTQSPTSLSFPLSPGATSSQTIFLTSPTSASGVSATFSENAVNNNFTSYTGTGSANYNVNVVAVDTTLPTTAITSPVNGATVTKGKVTTISASASDNVGVSSVKFYVNNKLTCTSYSAPYTCTWTVPNAPKKTYSLQSKAYDAAGNIGASALVSVKSL
jgi:hypothetical protein